MLEAITWNSYFSTLALGITAYYLIIIGLYYPKELRSLISGKSLQFNPSGQQDKERHLNRTDQKDIDLFEELEITVAELQGILGRAGNMTDKNQLLGQLSQVLSNHPGLRDPVYRVAIGNYLSENIPKLTHLNFRESELEKIWDE
ncbi:hypothetical protein SAMN04489724_3069 [Algoriphagus locisalis]|uniref:Uncharacterized protein n=1 Tax=Algoriphagus locisalis TaxID=305507 RepID=A0A1I7CCP0_9BACT|nr:hypothetical protein [Algoriphagus locisalis]SFT97208.1 hypothetical protein SAMN04489724_3069 [Algoriphagus locisalis]